MGEHKGIYAAVMRWYVDGAAEGDREALREAVACGALAWLNDSGKLGELEITHYRDRPLKGGGPAEGGS